MCFAGNCGLEINFSSDCDLFSAMFNEEAGWILEVQESDLPAVINLYQQTGVKVQHIGYSSGAGKTAKVVVEYNSEIILDQSMVTLRDIWEETSFKLELRQTNNDCVKAEKLGLSNRGKPSYSVSFDTLNLRPCTSFKAGGRRVAVIREEGINGDREMIASLFMAGFEVWDVTMTDLLMKKVTLSKFQGVVFPGGFSYADVLGSARGWAAGLLFHSELESQFTAFKNRPDTFSLGVCNGCQLMALLGWVGSISDDKGNISHGVSLQQNVSERFESRFVTVKIQESPSIMMKGMENSILGVWVAHGEGRFQFKASSIFDKIKSQNLIPIVYTDDSGVPTEEYPLNPNGSIEGIAAICSEDGRHIAMMPHPERCVLPWQWAWMPENWKDTMKVSPWLKMFVNAYDWCCRR